MTNVRNVPREMQMAEFDGGFLDDFARDGLARFGGQNYRGQGAGLGFWRKLRGLRDSIVVLHIAGDDVEDVVGAYRSV